MAKAGRQVDLRLLIVIVATVVWLTSEVLGYLKPGLGSEPGIGAAYMAVLAAALAFPELDRFKSHNKKDDPEDGSGK